MGKPIKKTDRNKVWARRQNARKAEDRGGYNKTFLIVCEGQTEELYFTSFKRKGIIIECIGMGCTKLELVSCTVEMKKHGDYDEVWTVFDMDLDTNRGGDQLAKFDNAIEKAQQNDIQVAYSNDAFELWFYLHYQYTEQQNLRFFYYEQLSKLWNINYEKEGKSRGFASKIFHILQEDERANLAEAIERADKLDEKMNTLPYHQQNPSTRVSVLVEALRNE